MHGLSAPYLTWCDPIFNKEVNYRLLLFIWRWASSFRLWDFHNNRMFFGIIVIPNQLSSFEKNSVAGLLISSVKNIRLKIYIHTPQYCCKYLHSSQIHTLHNPHSSILLQISTLLTNPHSPQSTLLNIVANIHTPHKFTLLHKPHSSILLQISTLLTNPNSLHNTHSSIWLQISTLLTNPHSPQSTLLNIVATIHTPHKPTLLHNPHSSI